MGNPRKVHFASALAAPFFLTTALGAMAGCVPPQQDIADQVAADAAEQYAIAERVGSPLDRCVRAQLVAEAYLQAKNKTEYEFWKLRQKVNCLEAGVPF